MHCSRVFLTPLYFYVQPRTNEGLFVKAPRKPYLRPAVQFDALVESLKLGDDAAVYGIGGVGKSSLARDVASTVRTAPELFDHRFTDAIFIACASPEGVEQQQRARSILDRIASAVDGETIPRDANAEKYVRNRYLNHKKVLIVIDNVWHEADAEMVCRLARDTPCRVLVTSRLVEVAHIVNNNADVHLTDNWFGAARSQQLFDDIVGSQTVIPAVAMQFVERVEFLPIAVSTIARAMKNAHRRHLSAEELARRYERVHGHDYTSTRELAHSHSHAYTLSHSLTFSQS